MSVSWGDVVRLVPALAGEVRDRFDARRHGVLGTLRRDGSARLSGIETTFAHGDLWLGMMPGSRKGADLRRDPRCSLLALGPDPDDDDPSAWVGDARIGGRAFEVTDPTLLERFAGDQAAMPPGASELFRIEISEIGLVRVGDPADHLVIETWHEATGSTKVARA
jgi:hypothetical protein